jgi:hypothetical protein
MSSLAPPQGPNRDDATARSASLWALLLVAVVLLLGAHRPPSTLRDLAALPGGVDLHWASGGGEAAITRAMRAVTPAKLASPDGPAGLPPTPSDPAVTPRAVAPWVETTAAPPARARHPAKPPATGPPRA